MLTNSTASKHHEHFSIRSGLIQSLNGLRVIISKCLGNGVWKCLEMSLLMTRFNLFNGNIFHNENE